MDNYIKGAAYIVIGILMLTLPVIHRFLYHDLKDDPGTRQRYNVVTWLALGLIVIGAAWIL